MARPQKFRLSPDDVLDPQNARKLAGHVAEIEFFRAEIEKLQGQVAGIYDAADDDGFDKKFIRKVVAIRAKDERELDAEEQAIEAYAAAVKKGLATRTREGNPKNLPEHDAETGEILDEVIQPETADDGLAEPACAHDDAAANTKSAPIQPDHVADAGNMVEADQSTAARMDVPEVARSRPADEGETPEKMGAGTQAPPVDTKPRTRDEIAADMGLPSDADPRCQQPKTCGSFSHVKLCHKCRVAAGLELEGAA